MFHPGDVIGPYTLLRVLGRGAFGEVWLAERRSSLLTTQVALKLPLDGSADLDAICEEAQIWLKASGHPNIVPVIDAEIYDGQVVIASEYVAGGSLSDWLTKHGGKAPSVEAAVSMMQGILAGLEHLHSNQLIHRDLKPDNVLLQSSLPRLADFGLTRVLKPSEHTVNISGTPGYMAPESFRGEYSAATDIWAAGILLHELLVGSLPYPQQDFHSILLAIASEAPITLSDLVLDALRPVLTKALDKPILNRFSSAAEMGAALTRAVIPDSTKVPDGLPSPAVAPSLTRPANNLPIQATSFIGRDKEMAEVKTLLSRTHLLTLTGAGGTGKTRLLLQVARDQLEAYSDGVWLVELAPLSDAALVAQAVASVLDIREKSGLTMPEAVADALKPRNLLLLLDNCEHVLDAAAVVVDTIQKHCPDVRILASSRESLGIAGEQTYRVPSLSLPPASARATPQVISQYEAVSLFVERALSVQSTFAVTNGNAPALANLCVRLDGIPLALELAAVRVRSLSIEEIDGRLDDRFHLLTRGSRTALPRHQTLRALVDWSYDLLTDQEKVLLSRLSVFAGGWTLAAAEYICAGDPIDEADVFDLLTSLVDKSLIAAERQEQQTRHRLLETVRQYALDRLAENGGSAAVRQRHQAFFVTLAEEAELQMRGPDQALWLDRLEKEHDNLRAALSWRADESSLRIAGALWRFWAMRGYFSEGRAWMTSVLAGADAQARTAARAKALNGAGSLAYRQGDYVRANELFEESLSLCRELGDKPGIATALYNMGSVACEQGDYTAARNLIEESLALRRAAGDKWGIATSLINLGHVACEQGEHVVARALHQESLAIQRELGDTWGIASSLINLGRLASDQ